MTLYRNVASLILALMLLQVASGILSVSTPLALSAMGVSALGVGVVAAVFSGGFMLGAWFAPDVVRSVGHIRAYSAAAAIYSAGILAMALAFDPVAWGAFRFVQGGASAIMFASAESWMADSTPRSQRGAVMGLYQLLIKVAMSLGPLLIVDHAPDDLRPFILAGLLMTLAMVPLCATRRAQPVIPDREAVSLKAVMTLPRPALAGAIVAGVANTGVMSQLPLYAQSLQPSSAQSAAATLSIAAWIGGTITQWPAGLFSDRTSRQIVVVILSALAMVACVCLYVSSGRVSWSITVLLAAMWGAGAMSFYPVSAAHATDRAEPGQIAQIMSGMLFVWAGGSVIGPVITGAVADTRLGQPGVFAVVALAYVFLGAVNFWSFLSERGRGGRARSAFTPIDQTSVVAGEIVERSTPPRGDGGSG